MLFRDRTDAGHQLAQALAQFRDQRPVIVALPRGGVPVAAEVARALGAPLDLLIVRKIGVPYEPELAMGAVVDGPNPLVVRNEDIIRAARISEASFARVRDRELEEIRRRRERYLTGHPSLVLKDCCVIVIDDGIATGATMRVALRAVRGQGPRRLVLAIPVASVEALGALRDETDEIVCLEALDHFGSIGAFYADFGQLTDNDVTRLLAEVSHPRSGVREA